MILTLIFTGLLLSAVKSNASNNITENTTQSPESTSHAVTVPTSDIPTTTAHATRSSKHWVVYYDETSDRFCIIMDAVIVIKLVKTTETHWIEFGPDAPNNATDSGKCGDVKNSITLKREPVQLTLTFSRSKPEVTNYNMSHIELVYNGSVEVSVNATEIPAWLNNIDNTRDYTCSKNETVFSGMNKMNETVLITMGQLRLEVFQNTTSNNPEFNSSAASCETTDNLIPIVVGAALGGLIIIVLVAYLIGRHRSRRGYESV